MPILPLLPWKTRSSARYTVSCTTLIFQEIETPVTQVSVRRGILNIKPVQIVFARAEQLQGLAMRRPSLQRQRMVSSSSR